MRNWDTIKKRSLMARRGVEDWRDAPGMMAPLMLPKAIRPRISKEELRKQAEQAFAQWCDRNGAEKATQSSTRP